MKALKVGCLIIGLFFFIYIFVSIYMYTSSGFEQEQTPFEVMTKKGVVNLHLGMPKDSVILLIGEPDDRKSHSFDNTIIEKIGYKVNNDKEEDLIFTFENGKLKRFSQD